MVKKKKVPRVPKFSEKDKKKQRKQEIIFGGFLILFSLLLMLAFTSYFFSWKEDFSTLGVLGDQTIEAQNHLRKLGAYISHWFIYQLFGISAYMFVYLLFLTGKAYFFKQTNTNLLKRWAWGMLQMLWLCVTLAFFYNYSPIIAGLVGFEINRFLITYIGSAGLIILLLFFLLCFLVLELNWTPEKIKAWLTPTISKTPDEVSPLDVETVAKEEDLPTSSTPLSVEPEEIKAPIAPPKTTVEAPIQMEIETITEETSEEKKLAMELVKKQGKYDPTLDLSSFRLPTLDLLKNYGDGSITINQEELEANKNKIVSTLKNYNIGIAHIKATIGPTVTLYEIIPEAGIRISKIKNLEDDIALSLSALGIRIIAPIPGKGTIGIEVPNQKPSIVSIRSVISAAKFQSAEMELPIALGKTISNETFVVDLVKMPHLLMAGATGQGKSVGLNTVLTSILYKKHPAEVKFILVDPKKVELNIYNKIERHYLAKLPDSEDAIITDNSKVINTLNSLCIEMDNRYELLKNGMCRNIKEYNKKFRERNLNPNDGHLFLPYIVLVVDEFADLIMTAGKEVETPIARLAQLARAVGIHLIIATQRPSVNVITGIIKANFPARIAFRVTSRIDSRTILDTGGADRLIGLGDMLYTQGNDLTRIQCAFVDTPEVEKIAAYVGAQKGYAEAHLLPEYVGEENSGNLDIDAADRDALFREAAEVIVIAQQGSASLLQRKLKLGYNRAGRIIDQMEAAGIVGPFEGSKARQVLVNDLAQLNQLLNNESL